MRIHRFFVKEPVKASLKSEPVVGAIFPIFDLDLVHQWKNVFKYTAGSRAVIFDSTGVEYTVMIHKVWGSSVDVEIVEVKKGENIESTPMDAPKSEKMPQNKPKNKHVWLFCSILKRDNFDLVVQKATELGASVIVPVISERTIKKAVNMARLEKISIEAVEQSGRMLVPRIMPEIALERALTDFVETQKGYVIVCQQGDSNLGVVNKVVRGMLTENPDMPIGMCIGPEGGWSPTELAFFEEKKYATLSFGQPVLRAETAAIVGLAYILL